MAGSHQHQASHDRFEQIKTLIETKQFQDPQSIDIGQDNFQAKSENADLMKILIQKTPFLGSKKEPFSNEYKKIVQQFFKKLAGNYDVARKCEIADLLMKTKYDDELKIFNFLGYVILYMFPIGKT